MTGLCVVLATLAAASVPASLLLKAVARQRAADAVRTRDWQPTDATCPPECTCGSWQWV